MTGKKRLRFAVTAACVCAAAILVYLIQVAAYQKAVKNITYSNAAIAAAPDGTYIGSCDVKFIRAKVSVTVRDGKIVQITLLEHKNDRGAPAEKILGDIVAQQRVEVDAVAGATNSSKVIKKAVDNALAAQAENPYS